MKIKKGDTVLIMQGKDKGKTGKVVKSLPRENHIVVEGVNLLVRHLKARRQREKGEKTKLPAPIDASNAMIVCSQCNRPTRVGFSMQGTKKFRMCKKCKKTL